MTRHQFIEGMKALNNPDQGMRYHGGGFDNDGPLFDERTGARLPPRISSAELTVYGDRARFLYALIQGADAVLALIASEEA